MSGSRKARPLKRDETQRRDTRIIVIATEDSDTQKPYFEQFRDSRVHFIVLPSVDGQSAPQHVLDNLTKYRDQYHWYPGDQFWLSIDNDRWHKLGEIAAFLHQRGFHLAVSRPCFEFWLLLHLCDPPETALFPNCQKVTDYLRKILGGSYSKTSPPLDRLKDGISTAMERARRLDPDPDNSLLAAPGSRVYRILESINSLRR